MDRVERTWIFRGEVLDVSLLPACAAVAKEWENADQREVLKTFAAMDALLTMPQRRWPKTRAELINSVHITGGTLWEVKAPARHGDYSDTGVSSARLRAACVARGIGSPEEDAGAAARMGQAGQGTYRQRAGEGDVVKELPEHLAHMTLAERAAFEDEVLRVIVADTFSVLMDELGISQRELARRLGVRESAVSRALSGTQNLRLSTIARMAHALGVTVRPQLAQGYREGTVAESDGSLPAWVVTAAPLASPDTSPPAAITARVSMRRSR